MCDCLKVACNQVQEHFKNKHGDNALVSNPSCKNEDLIIEKGGMKLRTYNTIEVDFTPKKKDGTLGKKRKLTMPVLHAYCPSCGKPFEEEKINNPDDLTSGQQ